MKFNELAFGLIYPNIEASGSSTVLGELISFLEGKREADDRLNDEIYICYILAFLAAIPTMLAMVYAWRRQNADAIAASAVEQYGHISLNPRPYPGKKVVNFLTIGGPFGLLSYGGVTNLLKKRLARHFVIPIAATAGLISAFGNYELHGEHANAEEGFVTLFMRLPRLTKIKLLLISVSILAGNLMQGYLDGDVFFASLELRVNNRLESALSSVILGILVMCREGYTEVHSLAANYANRSEQNSVDARHIFLVSQLWVSLFGSVMQGIFPVAGMINFAQAMHQLVNKKPLAETLDRSQRYLLLAVATILLFGPNARGFYATTIDSVDEAIKDMGKNIYSSYVACRSRLFPIPEYRRHLLTAAPVSPPVEEVTAQPEASDSFIQQDSSTATHSR